MIANWLPGNQPNLSIKSQSIMDSYIIRYVYWALSRVLWDVISNKSWSLWTTASKVNFRLPRPFNATLYHNHITPPNNCINISMIDIFFFNFPKPYMQQVKSSPWKVYTMWTGEVQDMYPASASRHVSFFNFITTRNEVEAGYTTTSASDT